MTDGERPSVLATGVGAIIGQGIVRSLRRCLPAVRVVGIDRSSRSPGPSMCDAFVAKPAVDEADPAYLEFWSGLATLERLDLVLPGLEVDVEFLDRHRDRFAALGVPVALNRPELIALCADKWALMQALPALGLPAIPSRVDVTWDTAVAALGPAPLLLKPRRGNGSRGIVRLQDGDEFHYWSARTPGWMLQTLVGSDEEEYTVGVFGFGDGDALEPIVFRRRLSAAGNTQEAEVVDAPAIVAAAAILTRAFAPLGPTNYQFRLHGDTPYLLEINPRFSSSNSLRTAFGYNEAQMCVDWFLLGRRPAAPRIRRGVAWRYLEDFVVDAGRPV